MARKEIHNRAEWEQLVGRCVLAFNDLEHQAIVLMCCLPECHFPKTAKTLDMSFRLSLLLEALERSEDPQRIELRSILSEAQDLLKKRNLLAHGPMVFEFRRNPGGSGVSINGAIQSLRNSHKRLTYTEVEALAAHVDELATRLTQAIEPVLHEMPE